MNGPDPPVLLAVESSCDETAVAVLQGFNNLRASVIGSQAVQHEETGGVVPEVASRLHLDVLPGLSKSAIKKSGIPLSQIAAFAATSGPGLAPALLIGLSYAKGLALGANRPFFPINHIEGHLLSPFFGEETIPEFLGLVVSGGHTLLVKVRRFGSYEVVGRTLDDAAGEAFDKAGKLLGLPYPAGALVDELAEHGNPLRFDLPRGMLQSGDHHFSFSGMKTAVRYLIEKGSITNDQDRADLCASFREAVVDVLVKKCIRAALDSRCNVVGASGGVSSNRLLRSRMETAAKDHGIQIRFAPEGLRTDNAAMIAYVAAHRLAAGHAGGLDADVEPSLHWENVG